MLTSSAPEATKRLETQKSKTIFGTYFWYLFLIQGWLRTFFQRFAIPDPAFARVAGELEILREFERIDRTGIFAEAAEHAAAQVVGKICKLLAASLLIARTGYDDQILRARHGAEIAGNAHGLVGIDINVEPRRATKALGDLGPLHRILLGVDFLGILITKSDLHPLQQVEEENLAQQIGYRHNGVAYHSDFELANAVVTAPARLESHMFWSRLPVGICLRSRGGC
jgi:hypothetical protein